MGVLYGIRDGWIVTKRNLLRYLRLPQLIFFSSIQPIMFLTLFNFVFGGALGASLASGDKYINYLLPGILVQTILFLMIQSSMLQTIILEIPSTLDLLVISYKVQLVTNTQVLFVTTQMEHGSFLVM